MDIILKKYNYYCSKKDDIDEHLPTLCEYATECESIIELGVRGCISSWAFILGLLQNEKPVKRIFLNDIQTCDISELLEVMEDSPVKVDFQWINDLHLETKERFDLTFIDTWHVYAQLKRELAKYAPITNKYIIMHDTTVDEVVGETIRNGWNPYEQSLQTGFPVDEIVCGLGKAIDEFLRDNKDWVLHKKYTNNNGLTILRRVA